VTNASYIGACFFSSPIIMHLVYMIACCIGVFIRAFAMWRQETSYVTAIGEAFHKAPIEVDYFVNKWIHYKANSPNIKCTFWHYKKKDSILEKDFSCKQKKANLLVQIPMLEKVWQQWWFLQQANSQALYILQICWVWES